MHNLKFNILFLGADDEIGVSCGTEWITDHQQGDVNIFGILQNVIGSLLDQLAIGQYQWTSVKFFLELFFLGILKLIELIASAVIQTHTKAV